MPESTTARTVVRGGGVGSTQPTGRPSAPWICAVIDSGTYLDRGFVLGLAVAYRTAARRFEISSGFVFGSGGYGWAFRGRLFALTGPVRPYLVGGLNYGFAGTSGAYAGGGVLVASGRAGAVSMDFFAESGVGAGTDAAGSFRFVPIIAGVSFGRSQP